MKELNFTKDELKKLIKNKYIASGSEASIYEYNDNIAIRLYDVEENIYCALTGKVLGKPQCKNMVDKLKIYQPSIKLTQFPLTIIKENDIVVGQIIKFYKNAPTLTEFLTDNPSIDPIPYYLQALDILEELTNHNICYEDVHGKNFLVVDNELKLIDFSDHRVKINENYKELYYPMFQNFNSMVNRINFEYLHLEDTYERLVIPQRIKKDTTNLKEDFKEIREMLLNLKKPKKNNR